MHYGTNPTVDTKDEPLSTFAADVDTGSYSLARAYLERGVLPDEAAVRVEEFVNAFDYGYRAPAKEAFAVQVEAFPSPNRRGYHVLHIGVKAKEVSVEERKRANLVFTLDVSGSMGMENRLSLAKRALTCWSISCRKATRWRWSSTAMTRAPCCRHAGVEAREDHRGDFANAARGQHQRSGGHRARLRHRAEGVHSRRHQPRHPLQRWGGEQRHQPRPTEFSPR